MPADDPTFSMLPPPPSVLPAGDVPFLDTPWVPPQTKRQAWFWLLFAVIGFLVGQIGAVIFAAIGGAINGDTSAQLQAIASAHGGRVWAEEAPSGGARMVLEIPLRRRPAPA